MDYSESLVVGVILVVLVVGGFLTHVSVKAARRTEALTMWALGAGIALITVGTVITDLYILGRTEPIGSFELGVSCLTALGFLALAYSVYRD